MYILLSVDALSSISSVGSDNYGEGRAASRIPSNDFTPSTEGLTNGTAADGDILQTGTSRRISRPEDVPGSDDDASKSSSSNNNNNASCQEFNMAAETNTSCPNLHPLLISEMKNSTSGPINPAEVASVNAMLLTIQQQQYYQMQLLQQLQRQLAAGLFTPPGHPAEFLRIPTLRFPLFGNFNPFPMAGVYGNPNADFRRFDGFPKNSRTQFVGPSQDIGPSPMATSPNLEHRTCFLVQRPLSNPQPSPTILQSGIHAQ